VDRDLGQSYMKILGSRLISKLGSSLKIIISQSIVSIQSKVLCAQNLGGSYKSHGLCAMIRVDDMSPPRPLPCPGRCRQTYQLWNRVHVRDSRERGSEQPSVPCSGTNLLVRSIKRQLYSGLCHFPLPLGSNRGPRHKRDRDSRLNYSAVACL
jgi:hypothetical protein